MQNNIYKPRYSIAHVAQSKVWIYKNSRLRGFNFPRGRRLRRGGLFRHYVLVLTTRKWRIARRGLRPFRRRIGAGRSRGKRRNGRPRRRRYREAFYTKQQLRAFHGKRSEQAFRTFIQNFRASGHPSTGTASQSFASSLSSRLDRILFRRRFRPTIFACHQFIHHAGVSVNGVLTFAPQSILKVGDTVSLVPTSTGSRAAGLFVSDRSARRHAHRPTPVNTPLGLLPTAPAADDFLPIYSELREIESKTGPSTKTSRRLQRRRFIPAVRRLLLWRAVYRDVFARVYYRRWGLYTLRRRLSAQLRRKVRPFARPVPTILPLLRFSNPTAARRAIPALHHSSLRTNPLAPSSQAFQSDPLLSSQFRHLLKAGLSLRLRASLLPRVSAVPSGRFASGFHRPFLRSRRRRYLRSRRFKTLRRRKLPRLRPVHRYIPSYLQRDFRTLRATRVQSPSSESVVFPFRGSLAQVEAFYRSRAF